MKIWLIDKQKWFLVTKEEGMRILKANLDVWTRESIQPYLLY